MGAEPVAESHKDKRVTIRLREGGWYQLKSLALEQRKTLNAVINEKFNAYLEKR